MPLPDISSTRRPAASGRLICLLLGCLAAASALGQEHHHEEVAQQPAAGAPSPLYTEDDLMFLTHMIVHHQQALEMAALVPTRSSREEFIRFARYVDGAQQAEIDQMNTLLSAAADRGMKAPHHPMSGDPPMSGMLSKAQMAALAAARGPEFEKRWLQGMIYHHQGALDMARAQQQRQFETGRHPYGIDVLVDDILVTQRAEITKMQEWLAQWGLSTMAR
jgi:uncharacterized protein (DUF305 family)